jgi:hypothetical protein
MSAGNFTLYDNAKLLLLNGGLNMASDTLAAVLLTSDYTPSAAHSTWADVSADECADADYAEKAVSGESVTAASGTVTVDTDDISFGSNVTITAKYLVLVKGTAGSLATDAVLVGYCDLNTADPGDSVSSTAAGFAVNTPNGLFTAS